MLQELHYCLYLKEKLVKVGSQHLPKRLKELTHSQMTHWYISDTYMVNRARVLTLK